MKPTSASIRDAFERARARTHLAHFVRVDGATALYEVQSDSDPALVHRVHVHTGSRDLMSCSCPGAARVACWHRAVVAITRANREAQGLPIDGPAPEHTASAAARQSDPLGPARFQRAINDVHRNKLALEELRAERARQRKDPDYAVRFFGGLDEAKPAERRSAADLAALFA